MTRVPTGGSERNDGPEKVRAGSIDSGHLLLVGAGPGLGLAVARRFAAGGYRVTLVARSADRLGELARSLDDTGAEINTVEADASSPEDLRARMTELYSDEGAPGVVIYNAVLGAPDQLLSSTVTHLQEAYAVDVIGAIVVAQEAAPAMKAAGFGTMIVTGGGFADHPIPALATVSPPVQGSPSQRPARVVRDERADRGSDPHQTTARSNAPNSQGSATAAAIRLVAPDRG